MALAQRMERTQAIGPQQRASSASLGRQDLRHPGRWRDQRRRGLGRRDDRGQVPARQSDAPSSTTTASSRPGAMTDVMHTEPIVDKWASFGWHVQEIHGHNVGEILNALDLADEVHARPSIIIARTTKGKGVSFMEYDNRWHGMSPNEEQYEAALAELGGGVTAMGKLESMPVSRCGRLMARRWSSSGHANPNVVALSADVSNSDFSYSLPEAFPDRFFNVGHRRAVSGGRGRRAGLQRQDPVRQHLRLPIRHARAGHGCARTCATARRTSS